MLFAFYVKRMLKGLSGLDSAKYISWSQIFNSSLSYGREGGSSSGCPTLSHHIWCQKQST